MTLTTTCRTAPQQGRTRDGRVASARGVLALALALPLLACDVDPAPVRAFQARLTADVPHRPCTPGEVGLCTPEAPADPGPWIRALQEVEGASEPAAAARWAALLVSFGADRPTLDRAIARLDSLAARPDAGEDPGAAPGAHGTARLSTALSALYHARARLAGSAEDLMAALDHATRAVERAPSDPAARFNLALALEDVGLCRRAAQAWREVAGSDPNPGWAAEAVAREEALTCPAEGEDPGQDFDRLVSTALPALLESGATAGGPGEAAVAVAAELARRIARLSGDSTALAVLAVTETLEVEARDELRAYLDARARLYTGTLQDGAAVLERASAFLEVELPSLLPMAEIDRAFFDIGQGRFTEAYARLDAVESLLDPARQPWFAGRVGWIGGLGATREGDRERGLGYYGRAREVFGRHGFGHAAASASMLEAEALTSLGMYRAAWEVRLEALAVLQRLAVSPMLHNVFITGAEAAQAQGLHAAAAALLVEGTAVAEELGIPIASIEVALRQGSVLAARGRSQEAVRRYRAARDLALALPPGRARERLSAYAGWGIYLAQPPGPDQWPAVDSLRSWFAEHGPVWQETDLRRVLATSLWAGGEAERARELFDGTFASLVDQVARTGDPTASREFWQSAQSLFDTAMALEMRVGSPDRALRILGLARDFAFGSPASPAPDALLGPARPLIALTTVGESLFWWRADPDGTRAGARILSGLDGRIQRFVEALRRGTLDPAEARGLYRDVLEEPLEGVSGEVAILADRGLATLPFSALVNPATGRHLIEERPWSLVATLEARSHGRTWDGAPGDRRPEWMAPPTPSRVLAVGDPAAGDPTVTWPPPLPGAEEEARGVFAVHGERGTLLVGSVATPENVRAGLAGADVFHFAGHAQRDSVSRPVVWLAAPEGGVRPHPVADLLVASAGSPGPTVRLVVLSACESLGPSRRRLDGFLGPAHPFLQAGVPAVVGTLWEADDRALVPVMVAFHRGLAGGATPSAALQTAVVEEGIEGPCCDWASLLPVTNGAGS